MFLSKRSAVMSLHKSFVHARSQLIQAHHNKSLFVAGYSSIFDQKKSGTTPDKLSRSKDSTIQGSQGGYGGSGISDAQGRYGGSGIQNHRDKAAPTLNRDGTNQRDDGEESNNERNMEDAARDTAGSMAGMAKSGVVGAVETGMKLGDMVKETMDSVYDATKRTTESVRDSVVDDDDDRGDKSDQNRLRKDSSKGF